MPKIYHYITADMSGKKAGIRALKLYYKKDDTESHILRILIADDGEDLTGFDNVTVTFLPQAAGSVPVVGSAALIEGYYEYEIGTTETATAGEIYFTVEGYSGTSRMTSNMFLFYVEDDIDTDDTIGSDTNYPILTGLIADANVATVEANEAAQNAITATKAANTVADMAEIRVDTAIGIAVSAADAANTAASSANTAKNAANSAANSANTAAELANTKATLANSRAGDAYTATVEATTQGNYAKTQGDYAKGQGDYAKSQGDYAKINGDNAGVLVDQLEIAKDAYDAATKANLSVEVSNARGTSPTLGARLDGVDSQLAEKATQITDLQNTKMDKNTTDISISQINKNFGKFDQTYMTDEFLQQMAGTTPVNTVPAPQSITTNRLLNKAIIPEKTNFFNVSTNLINEKTVTAGKAINSADGSLIDNTSYCVTDFIEVMQNTAYITNVVDRRAYYTSDKTFISSAAASGIFTTPANCYYIRQTVNNNSIGKSAQINYGSSLLPFEKYYAYILYNTVEELPDGTIVKEKTSFLKASSNLYNDSGAIENKGILSDGVISDNIDYVISDYIKVIPNNDYTFIGITNIVYYDKNKNFISRINTGFTMASPQPYTTTIIPDAGYIRCNILKKYTIRSITQINIGTSLLKYEPYYLYIDNFKSPLEIAKEKSYYFVPEIIAGVYTAIEKTYIHFTDLNTLHTAYDDLVANYPNYIKKTLLGKDASDTYPIYKYELIPEALPTSVLAKTLPKIILTSGVHGEEKPATDALYHMVYSLCNEWKTNPLLEYLRFNVEIVFIPVINPWGFTNNTRHNSNNVDINRNYSELWTLGVVGTQVYGGTAPWSEIESQYVKSILDNNTDAVFYSDLHSAGDGSDYSKLLYHVVPLQNYYKENTEILAVYNIEQMTRQYIKNYNLPDNIGYFGRLDHSIIGGIAPLYGISLGIPSTSSECFYKLPGEPNLYSSNTIKACSEWLVNWVLTIIKLAKQTIS